jgi:hypothetical protein
MIYFVSYWQLYNVLYVLTCQKLLLITDFTISSKLAYYLKWYPNLDIPFKYSRPRTSKNSTTNKKLQISRTFSKLTFNWNSIMLAAKTKIATLLQKEIFLFISPTIWFLSTESEISGLKTEMKWI